MADPIGAGSSSGGGGFNVQALYALQNTSSSTSNNNSVSVNTNHNDSKSDDTVHSFSENTSVNTSTSTDTSYVTSNNTSLTTSNNTSHNTNVDQSNSVSTSNTTSVTTANNTTFSQSDIEVATINGVASNYTADQNLAGINVHETAETDRLKLKLAFANDKFDAVLPLLTSVAGAVSGQDSGSSGGIGFHALARPTGLVAQGGGDFTAQSGDGIGFYSRTMRSGVESPRMGSGDVKTGGIGFASGSSVADAAAATALPFISTSGVLTPAQVQQAVNAAYSRNDVRTQSEIRRLVGDMTGRGFSPSSPILAALRVGLAGQNLRASLEGATQIQLEAAKLNAEAVFTSQKAVADQFAQQEQVLLDHERTGVTREVGILSAVAQMVTGAL